MQQIRLHLWKNEQKPNGADPETEQKADMGLMVALNMALEDAAFYCFHSGFF